MIGHAENKVVCAMVTTLTVSLINSIESYLHEDIDYSIKTGYFYASIDGLSENARMFYEAFIKNLLIISEDYPNSFKYI